MRVNITPLIKKHILESIAKPANVREEALLRSLFRVFDDFVEDYMGPTVAAARRTLINYSEHVVSTQYYTCIRIDAFGDPMLLKFQSSVQAVTPQFTWSPYNNQSDEDLLKTAPVISGPSVEKHRELLQELYDTRQDRATLVKEVGAVLDSAATLQQVHVLWPTVLDHVDVAVREKFHKPNEKAKPPVKVPVMTPAAIEALVKHRLETSA